MMKTTVLIIEDHEMVREMWTSVFEELDDIEVVGQCGDFNSAIEQVKKQLPDVVLLDLNLPDISGLDAIPFIRKESPASRIIVVSMHHQAAYARKVIALGAKGYVTKNSPPQEILDAVQTVMGGETYVCEEIRAQL
jgi:two-component system, NarL family, invasion response regulator UvrY